MNAGKIAALTLCVVLLEVRHARPAQDKAPKVSAPARKEPRNAIEEFLSRSDVVIVKRMYCIKTFSWGLRDDSAALAVSAMHAYEADHRDRRVFAVRFEARPHGETSFSAYLDPASARSLVSALENMIAIGRENSGESIEFQEIRFTLGDSLECGFAQQGTDQKPFVTLGADVLRTLRSSRMLDLEDLKDAVLQEIGRLKELGVN